MIRVVDIPGDKSISHRALILAAIHDGVTHIKGGLTGDDCLKTRDALRAMGVKIQQLPDEWIVHGVGLYGLKAPSHPINCGNSGTTMRLLAGILVGQPFDSVLLGDESLSKRPMMRIVTPLKAMGASIGATDGHAPLYIKGKQKLHAITYEMPIASAQVKSCILLAGLYAEGETKVIERYITRDHTERMLEVFQMPQKTRVIDVPADISSATFFMVLATLKSDIPMCFKSVGINPTRRGVIDILKAMGADITLNNERSYGKEPVADIVVSQAALTGTVIDKATLALAIDEFPILMIAAACAKGVTHIQGIEELRHKESDRVAAMVQGLENIGIDVRVKKDKVIVEGGVLQTGVVDSLSDHRVSMAFLVAKYVSQHNIDVRNTQMISTSFPEFEEKLSQAYSVDLISSLG